MLHHHLGITCIKHDTITWISHHSSSCLSLPIRAICFIIMWAKDSSSSNCQFMHPAEMIHSQPCVHRRNLLHIEECVASFWHWQLNLQSSIEEARTVDSTHGSKNKTDWQWVHWSLQHISIKKTSHMLTTSDPHWLISKPTTCTWSHRNSYKFSIQS